MPGRSTADVVRPDPAALLSWWSVERDDNLTVVLSEFARTLLTDFPIEGILDHLVRRMVDILPVDAAGVSLISPTARPHHVAGSDESAVRYERLQTDLGEGPCLAAYTTNEAVVVPDLTLDDRFPRFAGHARTEGLVAVFTFPLRNDDRCLGALDLYRTTAGELDEQDMATAQTLADVATAYLLNAEARVAKTDFVAKVSHELRTPMTSIAGFLELLQDGESGALNPQQETFVDAISRNSKRLTALADDLLVVAGLEPGRVGHELSEIDLSAVVRAAESALAHTRAARFVRLSFDVHPGPVVVYGNAHDLESVVTNLVGNALKFTEDGGWVRCTLHPSSGTARLTVSDNGVGIPEAEQRELFMRFFRSTTAQELAIQGSGLGLSIVDAIVQNHGGDISVASEHLVGSTFTVTLPLAT